MGAIIIIFAKAPRSGFVKTRLAAEIGDAWALGVYRWMALRQLRVIPSDYQVVVRFTPADAESEMRAWLGDDVRLLPQCEGDLGGRLAHASREAFADGAEAVVLLGTDCPSLGASEIVAAVEALETGFDAVFGPALDGGYYLLAMRAMQEALFRGIPWSDPRTLQASLEAAKQHGLKTALLSAHEDVDTVGELQRAVENGSVPREIAGYSSPL